MIVLFCFCFFVLFCFLKFLFCFYFFVLFCFLKFLFCFCFLFCFFCFVLFCFVSFSPAQGKNTNFFRMSALERKIFIISVFSLLQILFLYEYGRQK